MLKHKKFKIKKFIISLLIMICFLSTSLIAYIHFKINPILTRVAQIKVENLIVSAVNNSIYKVLKNGNVDYSELVNIKYDNNGKIAFIQANNTKINLIAIETVKQTKFEIDEISNNSIKIPTGSATGIPIFIGYGSEINVNFLSEGSVKCHFRSDFVSAGINQTKHKIYLDVESSIQLVLPLSNKVINTTVPILISETVLVGEIPEVYLGSSLWGNPPSQSNIFVP